MAWEMTGHHSRVGRGKFKWPCQAYHDQDLARQFQNAGKLPYLNWIFPTALEDRDAMQNAWFHPTPLTPFPSQRPELDDPEDEDGMIQSAKYILSLIEHQVAQGIPLERIVIAGFSQGCAMSLLMGLTSKYSGKLGGICGLAGFLPLADRFGDLRRDAELPQQVGRIPIFFMRGTRDMLVPKRYYRLCTEKLQELGLADELVEAKEYNDLGHSLSGAVIRDVCDWLERVIPPIG